MGDAGKSLVHQEKGHLLTNASELLTNASELLAIASE